MRRRFAFVVVLKVDAVVDGKREALAVDLEPVDRVVLRPGANWRGSHDPARFAPVEAIQAVAQVDSALAADDGREQPH